MKLLLMSLVFISAAALADGPRPQPQPRPQPAPPPSAQQLPVYEFANSLPDFLYTLNTSEGPARGFPSYGGISFYVLSAPQGGTEALYRCTVSATGRHMLSTSSNCEGQVPDYINGRSNVMGYISTQPRAGLVALYRYHQGGFVHYTSTNPQIPSGYQLDGILGYVQ